MDDLFKDFRHELRSVDKKPPSARKPTEVRTPTGYKLELVAKQKRDIQIVEQYFEGKTVAQLASQYRLSRGRISKILSKPKAMISKLGLSQEEVIEQLVKRIELI